MGINQKALYVSDQTRELETEVLKLAIKYTTLTGVDYVSDHLGTSKLYRQGLALIRVNLLDLIEEWENNKND